MRKYIDGLWFHKGYPIRAEHGGYTVSGCNSIVLNVYKTLNDAKFAIDKVADGTNKKEPRIIGELFCDDSGDMKMKKID